MTGKNIKVIGIGNGGNSIVKTLQGISKGILLNINSDRENNSENVPTLIVGEKTTRGMGCGGNPSMGRRTVKEDDYKVMGTFAGSEVIVLASAFGGGNGTGGLPVVSELARKAGKFVVSFITRPFTFEGDRRNKQAIEGIAELLDKTDGLFIMSNETLLTQIKPDSSYQDFFTLVDKRMSNYIKEIIEILETEKASEILEIIKESLLIFMGIGTSEDITSSVQQALSSPSLEVIDNNCRLLISLKTKNELLPGKNTIRELVNEFGFNPDKFIIHTAQDENLESEYEVKVFSFLMKNHDTDQYYLSKVFPNFPTDFTPVLEEIFPI